MNENETNQKENVITYEQVQERIKGKKLEEYTTEDLFDYFTLKGANNDEK